MAERVTAVDEIARAEAARARRGSRRRAYLRRRRARRAFAGFGRTRQPLEGFLFPATYDFFKQHDVEAARRATSSTRSGRTGRSVEPALRAQEEPDAVRRADHRVDDREGGAGAARAAARRGGDLQPAARADAARDRRDDPLRARRPADRVAARVAARRPDAVQHAARTRACRRRRSRTRASRRCRRPRTRRRSTTSTSCASRTTCTTSSRRATATFQNYANAHGYVARATRLVALLGHPVAHSLSPRMQNAAFAARGLDWAYVALDVAAGAARGGRARARGSGFAGANVTTPHKLAAARALRRGGRRVREHARVPRTGASSGRAPTRRCSTGSTSERPCRSSAPAAPRGAFARRAARARASSRGAATGRPTSRDADLVVNATPVARRGARRAARRADARRPAVPARRATALVAARAAGATVVDGLEVLVAPGRRVVRALDGRARAGRRDARTPYALRA